MYIYNVVSLSKINNFSHLLCLWTITIVLWWDIDLAYGSRDVRTILESCFIFLTFCDANMHAHSQIYIIVFEKLEFQQVLYIHISLMDICLNISLVSLY